MGNISRYAPELMPKICVHGVNQEMGISVVSGDSIEICLREIRLKVCVLGNSSERGGLAVVNF